MLSYTVISVYCCEISCWIVIVAVRTGISGFRSTVHL